MMGAELGIEIFMKIKIINERKKKREQRGESIIK
jgi:hypothetical protein